MGQLIVITGPIGAGKSTVARGLSEQLRDAGLSAAMVDLDDVFAMVSAWSRQSAVSWERARLVHGDLVAAWFRSGVDVVIAHGPFYTPEETAPLLAEILPTQQRRWVMLLAPYEVALERVKREPHGPVQGAGLPAFDARAVQRVASCNPTVRMDLRHNTDVC